MPNDIASDPLFRRMRAHASNKLQHGIDATREEVLADYKNYLRLEEAMVQRFHDKGDSGLRVARTRSIAMDVLLENLLQRALDTYERDHGELPCAVTVTALGGYGRAELSPFSDVDIMFLYPDRVRPDKLNKLQKVVSDSILYILWDLNLKVGHSSRTIKQSIQEAGSSIESKNALMESRVVAGSQSLYTEFRKAFRAFLKRDSVDAYLQSRLQDQSERRSKHGGTVFVQEPEIKNGVGGMRDYQNILWMAQIKLDVDSLEELLERDFIGRTEFRELSIAYEFLMRVRHELHFQSKRPTDKLSLDKQPSIAWALGYRQIDIFKRVESFMKDYYRHSRNIQKHSELVERRLAVQLKKLSFKAVIEAHRKEGRQDVDGFRIASGTISYISPEVFHEDPVRLISIFRYCQKYAVTLDFDLELLIRKSLRGITQKVIESDAANAKFKSILQQSGEVYPILLMMHDLGVLERFLPEFEGLSCLVQHEHYHRYTADYHTLSTIKYLDIIFQETDIGTARYSRELHLTSQPTLLYLTLLLHDIGKGKGIKGHAETGTVIAKPILERMGVSREYADKILFLIKNHLGMARIWQRYDIDDPRTAEGLAKLVGDEDRLRYLYVHTYCDARGTAEGLWNDYKGMLHYRLFKNTLDYLGTPIDQEERRRKKISMIPKERIQEKCSHIPDEELEAHFNLLPERYFIHHSADEVALHVDMVHRLLSRVSDAESMGSLIPVIDWQHDHDLNMSVVHVVTWDRAGLFYKLAGALSVAGVNIFSSKAISREDHITIDSFYVADDEGGPVENEEALKLFEEALVTALQNNTDMMPQIKAQARKKQKPTWRRDNDKLAAPIPSSVDVYHELSLKRTIIEVHTGDQIGILYQIARAIYEHGFDITFARISTERGVAVDTFYIEPTDKDAGEDNTPSLLALRQALNEIITPQVEKAQEA